MLPGDDVFNVERPGEFDLIRQAAIFAPFSGAAGPVAGVLVTLTRFSADKLLPRFELKRGNDIADFNQSVIFTLFFRRKLAFTGFGTKFLHSPADQFVLTQLRHGFGRIQIETPAQRLQQPIHHHRALQRILHGTSVTGGPILSLEEVKKERPKRRERR
jgi:hypothetical protein